MNRVSKFSHCFAYCFLSLTIIGFSVFSVVLHAALPPQKIAYIDATSLKKNDNNRYFPLLLEMALQKSQKKYGAFELIPLDTLISQSRQIKELEKGTIDVFWTMTTYARELDALPIRIPLTKGMYGLRVLAINQADKDKFTAFGNMEQIADMTAILGVDWPDTQVMRFNRFLVNTDVAEHELYPFISQQTGYYFPRGITEAWTEVEALNDPRVIVEQKHLLVYPTAIYFFVAKNNSLLAERIEYGLNAAMADGDFDRLFFNFPHHKASFAKVDFQHRMIYKMPNPFLPQSAPKALIEQMQQAIIDGQYH